MFWVTSSNFLPPDPASLHLWLQVPDRFYRQLEMYIWIVGIFDVGLQDSSGSYYDVPVALFELRSMDLGMIASKISS
ncbi:hypothetical protein A1F94_012486 [Pyrenophora tritici-repentis]|uniref:Uncharacterized protein n=1 Tax=Pyrenophora tritici-repentis TaxID=45151 RepID=A0A922N6D8_9PLEO|nr:hypothetical protein A1F94_012486 [Pyrenophora tritici-repentis]KAI1512149.1 hypothetical protein Ptr86124_008989 [Pyrenophora tritici-repentis]KAI1669055.1 hypothetical protein L13192_06514 [Pyrenophora tritici-repentis]KAI1684267.1 hypothetical protein KJE20_06772 [Pyrenophora tritici-repentis]